MSDFDKIDFVIPWVDGNDRQWQLEKAKYDNSVLMNESDTPVRYRDWDNLQYWFRAVEQFAPWVNKIYFITWGHIPAWLNTKNPRLQIVNHKDYIPKKYLPTFSSHTIELNIHRIPDIAEHFVYFNDDMFLLNRTEPSDFFVNGNPCDTYGLNCIYFGHDSAGHFNGSNLEIINTEFKNKHRIIKKNSKKWYSLKNGSRILLKTILLSPWEWFPGFHYNHLPSSFQKSTFEKIWEKYNKTLDKTCNDKFRRESNVNQWLMKYWQLCEGICEVRSDKIGECFHITEENFDSLCHTIKNQSRKLVCINDTPRTLDFENKKQKVKECFDLILPNQSSFEL